MIMSMSEWAKEEVEIACKKENPDWDHESFDYGCSCYMSALKAYNSLCEDGHSGMSFAITRNILDRLMRALPLTAIEDTDDMWNLIHEDKHHKSYQCRRMPSLFKNVYDNGKVEYSDADRIIAVDIHNDYLTYIGGVCNLALKLGLIPPITMPYFPSTQNYRIYTEDFNSQTGGRGSHDTYSIDSIKDPDGSIHEIHRYFSCAEPGKPDEEITEEEYIKRRDMAINKGWSPDKEMLDENK